MDVFNLVNSLGSLAISLAIGAIGVIMLLPHVAIWGWNKLAQLFNFEQLKANYKENQQINSAREHYKETKQKDRRKYWKQYYNDKVKNKTYH